MAWGFFNEVGRKLIHITILVILLIYAVLSKTYGEQAALLVLVALLIFFFVLEYFRLELNWKIPVFLAFIRPKEQHRMYGVIFFLSATIICLAVFDFPIALAALLMTTFGDMAAALVGKKYGTTLIFRNKTLAGLIAELFTNMIVGVIIGLFFSINIYAPILMAFTATIVETSLDELDDNLIVPICAGFVGQAIALLA
ncbi:CTP--2,3-di-O-geranylgeranyl-sn-glycero-1-phosphate cytidyltransferase [Candidatus Woesearchaeota archaeon]|nr:CTP--2,3-di-O-geranylgeranyl-sn-glycero-1-phosphate cytidyltransferase [Candidatus Woesearchaeota archaeon]